MQKLTTFLKALGIALAVMLLLVVLLAALLYFNTKAVLAKLLTLSATTSVHIEQLETHWQHGRLHITLGDLLVSWSDDAQAPPLLKVTKLQATIPLRRLLQRQLLITDIVIKDLQANLDKARIAALDDGADTDSYDTRIALLVGSVDASDMVFNLSGWLGDSEQTLHIDTLTLSGRQRGQARAIDMQGELNAQALTIHGTVQALNRFVLRRAPLNVDVTAHLPFVQAQVQGDIDIAPLNMHVDTQLALHFEAEHIDQLGQLIGYPLPAIDSIKLDTQLVGDANQLDSKDLSLAISGQALSANISGDVDNLLATPESTLHIELDVPDMPALLTPFKLAWPWQGGLHIAGQLVSDQQSLALSDFSIRVGDTPWQFAATGAALNVTPNPLMVDYFAAPTLPLQTMTWQSTTLIAQLTDHQGQWGYHYLFDHGELTQHPTSHFTLAGAGSYKGVAMQLQALLSEQNDFAIEVIPANAAIKASGRYTLSEQQPLLLDATVELDASSLDFLTQWLDQPNAAIKHAMVKASVSAKQQHWKMDLTSQLHTSGGQATIKANNVDLTDADPYQLDIDITSDQLGSLQRWLANNGRVIDGLSHTLTDGRYWASDSDQAKLAGTDPPDPWLQDLTDLLAIDAWLAQLPELNGQARIDFSVQQRDDIIDVVFHNVTIDAPQVQANWQGSITDIGQAMAVNGALKVNASADARVLGQVFGALSADVNLSTNGRMLDIAPTITSTKSHIGGSAQMVLGKDGVTSATGRLAIDKLDVRPFFSSTNTVDDSDQQGLAFLQPLFSTQPFNRDDILLPYDYVLRLYIDQLQTPWLVIDDFATELTQRDEAVSITRTSGQIDQGEVAAFASIDWSQQTPAIDVQLVGDRINPMAFEPFKNDGILKSGDADIYLKATGSGATPAAVMRSLNGHFTLTTVDTVLHGDDLSKISPELTSTLMRRLNPYYKKQTTTHIQCGYVDLAIDNGVMRADRSIVVVTPDIGFGASGSIDLRKEYIRMQVVPRNRKGLGLSVRGTFAKMAVIEGPLDNPKVVFDPTHALLESVQDVAGTIFYGPFYWLVYGQAQRILGSSSACKKHVKKLNKTAEAMHL